MRKPNMHTLISNWLVAKAYNRKPDYVVGNVANPYLIRWHLIPRNRFLNIYLHCIMQGDEAIHLHDHAYSSASVILDGYYVEHYIKAGGVHQRLIRNTGKIIIRPFGGKPHRIELPGAPVWSLFITGPRYREWGFHCPNGWVHHTKYTDPNNPGITGKGCDQ